MKGIKGFVLFVCIAAFLAAGGGATQAAKKTTRAKKKTVQKKSSKKKTGRYYVKPLEENLRRTPSGEKIGTVAQGTSVKVEKIQGNWAYVTVKGWIWRPSLSKSKPKQTEELLVGDVKGVFKKKQFIIKGRINNRTKADFSKIVLQGELFKGKKRVAHKTLTLFSSKKPLRAGKGYGFSIVFKRTRGFDSYSVRILSADRK